MPETMTSPVPGSNEEYFQRCSRADWTYDYSDDSVMWSRGKREIQTLRADANEPAKLAIFEAWQSWAGDSMSGRNPTRPNLQAVLAGVAIAT